MIPDTLNRHAEDLGVTLHQGKQELVRELEPLWLSLCDHHLSTGAAGLPVIQRSESWARRRALYEQLLRGQEAFVVVARRRSIAVGYALAHVHEGPDDTWTTGDRIGEVESLAVLPQERGLGLGTLLLDCTEAILDRPGAQDAMIGVLAGNDDALRFYERRGMTPAIVKLLRIGPKTTGQADDRPAWLCRYRPVPARAELPASPHRTRHRHRREPPDRRPGQRKYRST